MHFSAMNVLYAISLDSENRDDFDDPPNYDTSFKVLDAYDYSSITTIDVKRNIYDMSINGDGSLIALVENQPAYESKQETIVKLYAVGMKKLEHLDEVRSEKCVHSESNDVGDTEAVRNAAANADAALNEDMPNDNVDNMLMAGVAVVPEAAPAVVAPPPDPDGGIEAALDELNQVANDLQDLVDRNVQRLQGHRNVNNRSRNSQRNNGAIQRNPYHIRRIREQNQQTRRGGARGGGGAAAAAARGAGAGAGAAAELGDMRIHENDDLNELALSIFAMFAGRR